MGRAGEDDLVHRISWEITSLHLLPAASTCVCPGPPITTARPLLRCVVWSSPLEFGRCRGTLCDLLDAGFWKLWRGGRGRSSLCSQTSLLCMTATLECLCSVSFGTLVSAWGKGRGNANVPPPPSRNCACFGQRKNRGRNEGMTLNRWSRSGCRAPWAGGQQRQGI